MKETIEVVIAEGNWHEAREKANFYQSQGWALAGMWVDDEVNIRIDLERNISPLQIKENRQQTDLVR